MNREPPTISHIERNLGRIIDNGLSRTIKIDSETIHFLKFDGAPIEGATTICTSGLSKHQFKSLSGPVRQELLLGYFSAYESENWLPIISVVCEDMLNSHRAFELGDIYRLGGNFFPSKDIAALYCSYPAFYGDNIWKCDETTPATFFVWLFPITSGEVTFIEKNGPVVFEELLMKKRPRLLDFNRESMTS